MTPKRRKWVVVAAVAAAVGVGVVLVVLSFPIAQEGSGDQLVNGRLYSFEAESLFGGPPWQNYSYLGVTFGFHLWCAIEPGRRAGVRERDGVGRTLVSVRLLGTGPSSTRAGKPGCPRTATTPSNTAPGASSTCWSRRENDLPALRGP